MVIPSEIHESYTVLVSSESANLEEEPTPPSYTSDELAKLLSQVRVLSRIKYWCGQQTKPLRTEEGAWSCTKDTAVLGYAGGDKRSALPSPPRGVRRQSSTDSPTWAPARCSVGESPRYGGTPGFRADTRSSQKEVFLARHDKWRHQLLSAVREICYCLIPLPKVRPPIVSLIASRPLQILAVDYSKLDKATDGREDVLVMTEYLRSTVSLFRRGNSPPLQLLKYWWKSGLANLACHTSYTATKVGASKPQSSTNSANCTTFASPRQQHITWKGIPRARFNRTLHNLLRMIPPEVKRKWPDRLYTLLYAHILRRDFHLTSWCWTSTTSASRSSVERPRRRGRWWWL